MSTNYFTDMFSVSFVRGILLLCDIHKKAASCQYPLNLIFQTLFFILVKDDLKVIAIVVLFLFYLLLFIFLTLSMYMQNIITKFLETANISLQHHQNHHQQPHLQLKMVKYPFCLTILKQYLSRFLYEPPSESVE